MFACIDAHMHTYMQNMEVNRSQVCWCEASLVMTMWSMFVLLTLLKLNKTDFAIPDSIKRCESTQWGCMQHEHVFVPACMHMKGDTFSGSIMMMEQMILTTSMMKIGHRTCMCPRMTSEYMCACVCACVSEQVMSCVIQLYSSLCLGWPNKNRANMVFHSE